MSCLSVLTSSELFIKARCSSARYSIVYVSCVEVEVFCKPGLCARTDANQKRPDRAWLLIVIAVVTTAVYCGTLSNDQRRYRGLQQLRPHRLHRCGLAESNPRRGEWHHDYPHPCPMDRWRVERDARERCSRSCDGYDTGAPSADDGVGGVDRGPNGVSLNAVT